MSTYPLKYIKNKDGNRVLPITSLNAVRDTDGTPLTDILAEVDEKLLLKQDVIQDLSDIRQGAAAGTTAQQPETTLSGYGIIDAYSNVDGAEFESSVNSTLSTQNARINALNSSDVIVGSLPSSGVANKIYRVPGSSSFTDYAWNGSSFVAIATYSVNDSSIKMGAGDVCVHSKEMVFERGNIWMDDGMTLLNEYGRICTPYFINGADLKYIFCDNNVGTLFLFYSYSNGSYTYDYNKTNDYNLSQGEAGSVYKYGSRAFSESNYYVRIVSRLRDNSIFKPEDVKIIAYGNVDNFNDGSKVPSYLKTKVDNAIANILTKSVGGPTIVFPYVTDPHYTWRSSGRQLIKENVQVIKAICDAVSVDAVGMLGDISEMWGRNDKTAPVPSAVSDRNSQPDSVIYERFRWYCNLYINTFKRWFNIPGNHDGDSADFFNNDNWYAQANAKHNRDCVHRNGNSPYYYYDFEDMKVRFIFMSIPCSTEQTRTTQGASIVYGSEKTVHTLWGAGAEQLEWLANTALKTGDGWEVIVFSHTPINYNYPTGVDYSDLMGRVEDHVDIEGVFGAYHNHTRYVHGDLIADFTDYSSTKVLVSVSGHVHKDLVMNIGENGNDSDLLPNAMPCPIVTTDAEMLSGNRLALSSSQELFDVMVYNKKDRKIYFCRVGEGSDRSITIPV